MEAEGNQCDVAPSLFALVEQHHCGLMFFIAVLMLKRSPACLTMCCYAIISCAEANFEFGLTPQQISKYWVS